MTAPDEAPPARPLPIAATARFVKVMERAGWRCQCERPHPKHRGGRCEATHHTGCKLVAGPAHPGPDPARSIAVDPADEMAWCPACWDLAVSSARRTARNAARAMDPGPESLF